MRLRLHLESTIYGLSFAPGLRLPRGHGGVGLSDPRKTASLSEHSV
jgi:hypothetical protein